MEAEHIITEEQHKEILEHPDLQSLVAILNQLPAFKPRGRRREKYGGLLLSNSGTGLLDRMRRFERSFDTICQVDGFGCLAWGLMKFLVVNVCITHALVGVIHQSLTHRTIAGKRHT
jgi:hypothetical protein